MAISRDVYKQIGRASAGAVSIVAAYANASNVPVGLTVSSFATLSFEPLLVMFAIQHNADSYPANQRVLAHTPAYILRWVG
jgi:flavin reductase (DIM6/NTAB) family NADH-FMN oxidoreductase RutF